MKTETKTVAEYKAPKCKVVMIHYEGALMDGASTGESYDDETTFGGEWN